MARISKRELQESLVELSNNYGELSDNYIHVSESLAELELARDSIGWIPLGAFDGREFPREFLREIYNRAIDSYIGNPLTNHGVKVQGNYVFGQGVTIKGESPDVDKLWQLFWDHPSNRIEFTSYQALFLKEVDLQLEGNLFLPLFTAPATGAVQIRSIHSNEIQDILTNPEDSQEPWYYHRVWSKTALPMVASFSSGLQQMNEYYPAWNWRPKNKPTTIKGKRVNWDSPIYHVKVGGTSFMRFGVTEIYSALDWSRASKEAMEDYATVRKAHARWAWGATVKGGKEGVAAAKAKLNTTIGESTGERNPSPLAGSTFIGAEGMARLEVLKTAGSQAPADEARMLMVMAAAGFGQPYSILTGDADKSNLATAKSLDRPTELGMSMRQRLWTTIFQNINTYIQWASMRAPAGVLKGKLVLDEWGVPRIDLGKEDGEPIPTNIVVEWPPILEHDVSESIAAIVSAATLDGKQDANIIDRATLIRLIGTTLGIENVEQMIDEVLAEDANAPPAEDMTQEAMFIQELKGLQEVLKKER